MAGRPDEINDIRSTFYTYILQVELQFLLVGFKFTGQLVALMVERKQTLQEG